MNESLEMLEYIYKACNMSITSLKELDKDLKDKDNKIRKSISDEIKEYTSFISKCEEIIEKNEFDVKKENFFVKEMAKMGIRKEVSSDNSDSAIAKMLIEGITMGVTEIECKIKNYKDDLSKDVFDFSKNFIKYQEDEIKRLKEYL